MILESKPTKIAFIIAAFLCLIGLMLEGIAELFHLKRLETIATNITIMGAFAIGTFALLMLGDLAYDVLTS